MPHAVQPETQLTLETETRQALEDRIFPRWSNSSVLCLMSLFLVKGIVHNFFIFGQITYFE